MARRFDLREPLEAVQWTCDAESTAEVTAFVERCGAEVGKLGDALLIVDKNGTRSRRVWPGSYVFFMGAVRVSDGRTFEEFYEGVDDE